MYKKNLFLYLYVFRFLSTSASKGELRIEITKALIKR